MRTILATAILAVLAWVPTAPAGATSSTCVDDTTAASIHQGQLQRRVERHTGAGVRVMRDAISYGVQYPTCDPTRELVVLYMRGTHRVATVLYVAS